jgi:hypothetical protein
MKFPQYYGTILEVALHITESNIDFRVAKIKHDGEFTPFTDFETIFHNLQPHSALASPETESDYLRLIADGCLAVLLPTEDLNSDCERTLVREILASLILRKSLDLMSEPYMMYEVIHNVPHYLCFAKNRLYEFKHDGNQSRRRNPFPRHYGRG